MKTRRLHFEQLESRLLMTATVSQSGDVLSIIGTNKPEYVNIHQHDADTFHITGNVFNSGRVFNGIEKININLAGKNDNLNMYTTYGAQYDNSLPDGLLVDLGKGHDKAIIWDLSVTSGSGIVNGGGGRDAIEVAYMSFLNLDVNGGGGNDAIDIYRFTAGELNVDGGLGNNTAYIYEGSIGGPGYDVSITNVSYLEVEYCHVNGNFSVTTTAWSDYVYLEEVNFHAAVDVLLGAAYDILEVEDCVFDDDVLLDGGDGFDELLGTGNSFQITPVIVNFEA